MDVILLEGWNEKEDCISEVSLIHNSQYDGKWIPKAITNSVDKREWKIIQISNSEYHTNLIVHVLENMFVVGFNLWRVQVGSLFDNLIIKIKEIIDNSFDYQKSKEMYNHQKGYHKKVKRSTNRRIVKKILNVIKYDQL